MIVIFLKSDFSDNAARTDEEKDTRHKDMFLFRHVSPKTCKHFSVVL